MIGGAGGSFPATLWKCNDTPGKIRVGAQSNLARFSLQKISDRTHAGMTWPM
jgi:hypothetical protein